MPFGFYFSVCKIPFVESTTANSVFVPPMSIPKTILLTIYSLKASFAASILIFPIINNSAAALFVEIGIFFYHKYLKALLYLDDMIEQLKGL